MRPSRIVLVMLEPPIPFGNAAARSYYVLLRGLVERGHRVTAFAACSQPEQIEQAHSLFPSQTYDLRCYPIPRRKGLQAKLATALRPISYMFSPELCRDLHRTLDEGFDILHLEQVWSGWIGLKWRTRALLNVRYLSSIDLEEAPTGNWKNWLHRRLVLSGEQRLLRKFPHIRTLSGRLSDHLRDRCPKARIYTIPSSLDLDQYSYVTDERRAPGSTISLIGSMNWYPSYSAAVRLLTRLWPEIQRRVPEARIQIVGWEARTALREFLSTPGVTVLENVVDIRPYFEQTTAMVYAPLRGSGMKVKVLEAMALGIPVVTTSEGVEGIPAEDGLHAGVCEDDSGLIERTVRLLRDRSLQNTQRTAGRALVETHCSPRSTLDALERTYESILDAAPARR